MCKLVVTQVEADDGRCHLHVFLKLLLHFGVCIGRWSLLGFVCNIPKVHGSQQHLHFELLTVELVYDFSLLTLKKCHHTLEDWVYTL